MTPSRLAEIRRKWSADTTLEECIEIAKNSSMSRQEREDILCNSDVLWGDDPDIETLMSRIGNVLIDYVRHPFDIPTVAERGVC